MKKLTFVISFVFGFIFSLFGQATIGKPTNTFDIGCDCSSPIPINFYTDSDPWAEDWRNWEWYPKQGQIPANNYLAPGMIADITIAVAPASQCSVDAWNLNAMRWLQTGKGASPVQNTPTDFTPVAGLAWSDFVDATSSNIRFWRNRELRPEDCDQQGTRIHALLAIRQSPEPVNLERIEYGAQGVDVWQDHYTDSRLGDYGFANQGTQYGSDGRKGTSDDKSIRAGPNYQGVNELYSLGFWMAKEVRYSSDLYQVRQQFEGCNRYSFWYRIWGAVTGKLLAELRVDVPVGYSAPISFTLEMSRAGQVFMDFQATGSQQARLYSATDARGPWTPMFDYPLWPGKYPVQIGTVPVYKDGKVVGRVIEPARFFRLGW